MADGLEALGLATAALAVASLSLTAFGLRQRRYEGWRWWVVALWLTTGGAAVATAWEGPVGAALASLLLMLWPVLALIGLRRFHPRQSLPGREGQDWAALVAGGLLCAGAALPGLALGWLASAAVVAVQLYAAGVLFMGPRGRDFTPVRCLAGTMVLAALASAVTMVPAAGLPAALLVQAASAALGTAVLAFVAITLVCERTERQLRDSRRRLRVLANLDTLTQVPNRRHFQELADHALLQDEPGTAVLLVFDVDHFKQINDLFGHAAGDRALALVSSAMLEHLRAQDVPGRQGGDEFVLLLRRTTTRQAMGVAARIVAEVQRRAPGQQLPTLTLSFGMVQVGFGEGIHAAMRRADQAMYEAKRQGRSRAVAAAGNEDQPVFEKSQPMGLTAA
jgi:diguanylate cyclase (GGDEF)-like protein